jgi:hypothetical protein
MAFVRKQRAGSELDGRQAVKDEAADYVVEPIRSYPEPE